MRYRFPDNFWWGSACSALQTEGDSLNGGKSQTTGMYGSNASQAASIKVLARRTHQPFINTGKKILPC